MNFFKGTCGSGGSFGGEIKSRGYKNNYFYDHCYLRFENEVGKTFQVTFSHKRKDDDRMILISLSLQIDRNVAI